MQRFGGQSMVEPLRRVLVQRPTETFGGADPARWGYRAGPRLARAQDEHDAFCALLAAADVEVLQQDDDGGSADALYTHDASLITDAGAVVLRMGKALRRGEPAAAARRYAALGVPVLGHIEAGSVEGGDLLWLDERTLAIGVGFRTDAVGMAALGKLLRPLGVAVLPFHLPYHRGPDACLHLMSLISLLDHDLALVHAPLLPTPLWQQLDRRGVRRVVVPEEEFDSQGPNVLALAPRRCLALEGNPRTRDRLIEAGCTVTTYRGDEISLNGHGGPTCLTRPLLRGQQP